MKKTTPEQWQEAEKMKAEGKTQKEIAGFLGVSQGRVSQKFGKKRDVENIPDRNP